MMKGDFIGVREDANVFVLEKRFIVKETGRAILRATALGLYFAEINGMRAGDAELGERGDSKRAPQLVDEIACHMAEGVGPGAFVLLGIGGKAYAHRVDDDGEDAVVPHGWSFPA